jgi:hypothetical protein
VPKKDEERKEDLRHQQAGSLNGRHENAPAVHNGWRSGIHSAVAMLIAAAAFIVVANPPVSVANLFMTADTGASQPQYRADKDTQDRAVCEKLRQVKLRKLV